MGLSQRGKPVRQVRRSLGSIRLRVLLLATALGISGGSASGLAADPPSDFSVTGEAPQALPEKAPPADAVPDIGLENLLKLPSSWEGSEQTRRGLSAGQWRARFAGLAKEQQAVEEGLREARRELDGMAGQGGGPWQMGAPGSNNTEVTPMSFKHRELIRSGKEQLEAIRRRERALNIEADMAGVPEAWRVFDSPSEP